MIHLFVKTTVPITKSDAFAVSKKLQARFFTKLLVVAFRSDEWFATNLEFPVIYPFGKNLSPIDPRTIKIHDDAMCVALNDEFTC
jgi:hypothetical protein